MNEKVKKKRHICKAICWRGIATGTTLTLTYIFTSDLKKAGTIAIVDMVLKFILYYGHERIWYKYIKFGVKKEDDEIKLDEIKLDEIINNEEP
jgi:uncharacterized membrane protein